VRVGERVWGESWGASWVRELGERVWGELVFFGSFWERVWGIEFRG